jgi:hypothetical protein
LRSWCRHHYDQRAAVMTGFADDATAASTVEYWATPYLRRWPRASPQCVAWQQNDGLNGVYAKTSRLGLRLPRLPAVDERRDEVKKRVCMESSRLQGWSTGPSCHRTKPTLPVSWACPAVGSMFASPSAGPGCWFSRAYPLYTGESFIKPKTKKPAPKPSSRRWRFRATTATYGLSGSLTSWRALGVICHYHRERCSQRSFFIPLRNIEVYADELNTVHFLSRTTGSPRADRS